MRSTRFKEISPLPGRPHSAWTQHQQVNIVISKKYRWKNFGPLWPIKRNSKNKKSNQSGSSRSWLLRRFAKGPCRAQAHPWRSCRAPRQPPRPISRSCCLQSGRWPAASSACEHIFHEGLNLIGVLQTCTPEFFSRPWFQGKNMFRLQRQIQEGVGDAKVSDGTNPSFSFAGSKHHDRPIHRLILVAHPLQYLRLWCVRAAVVLPADGDVAKVHLFHQSQCQQLHPASVPKGSVGGRLPDCLIHDNRMKVSQTLVFEIRDHLKHLSLARRMMSVYHK